jgi:flagellar hook-basal body complex protein FliE
MSAPILPISHATLPLDIRPAAQPGASGGFQDVLSTAIQTVEAIGHNASTSVERFLSGEGEELHTTILAATQAELSFNLFMQARNKAVAAYQEIIRMQM